MVGVGSTHFNLTRSFVDYALHANDKLDVAQISSANRLIDQELSELLARSGADRTMVARFHDGRVDTQGIHFLYLTRTNEITRDGITSVLEQTQDTPLAVFKDMLDSFEHNKCYVLERSSAVDKAPESQFYNNLGVQSVVRCPVYNDHGILAGTVGMDFITKPIDPRTIDRAVDTLSATARKVGHIFSGECNKVVNDSHKV